MVSHKVKVSIFGLVTTSQVFVPFAHAVHDGINNDGKIINAAGEILLYGMNDFSEELGLKWVAGEFNSVDSNSEFNITTFSVLKEKPDALYFSQNRLSKTEDSSTLNIGAGVYKLLDASGLMPSYLADRNVVVGANVFLDVQSGTNSLFNILGPGVHKRYSVGGVLKTSGIDINANIYRAITNELDGYNITNGWDYGIDGVIPGLEQVKLGASAYNFTGTNEVLKGRKFNIEYKPNSMFTFGTMYDDVNDSDVDTQSVYAKITYTFNAPTDEQLQLKSFEPSTVWDKRYDEVKRENTIRMEKIASIPEIVIGDSVSTINIRGNDTTDIVIKLSQALSAGQEVTLNAESSQPRYIGFVVNSGDNMGSTDSSDDENTSPVAETKLVFTSDNWESGFTLKLESLRAMEADAPTKATITLKVSSNNTATDFANMLEKELTVNILPVSGQSDGVVAVDQPEIAPWGTDIQLTGVTGGGTGAITYAVTNDFASIGATVDSAGLVSGTTKSGAVVVTVSRAADNKYLASSKEVIVVFGKSDADVTVATPPVVMWGTDVQISGVSGGGTGAITYAVTNDLASIGATVDNAGLVSGTTKSGVIVVTVSRAGDANYEASSVDVIVVFDKSDADVTVTTPGAVMWGNDIQIPLATGGGTGAITYTVKTDSDLIGATVDGSGLVSGATEAGSVVITVSRAGDDNFEASSVDVIVTFNKSDSDVTVATPGVVAWGTDVQISDVIGGGTGAITYAVKDDFDSIDATVDNAGLVSGATKAGAIVVTVSRAGDDNFEASSVDVIVAFDKSDADVTVVTPASVVWETNVQISGVSGGGTGAITYAVKTDADSIGATVDGSTGLVSGATKAGSVVITVSRAADANYNASSADVIVTFDKSNADVTVATPPVVMWGVDVQISGVSGGGTGAITYAVTNDSDSIGATVDNAGLVSGTTKSGVIVVTVSRAGDANYEASSVDVIVVFDKSEGDVTVATPGAVMWGNDIQIPLAIGGGTGAITYAVKTDADSIGATVDGSGLVSGATEAGFVVITVSRAADANFEASSVDVTVVFGKSDADVTVVTPASVAWDTNAQISGVSGGGTGAITYTVKTDSDSIGATVDSSGLVSGATKAGAIVVTVSRATDANYEASSVDVTVVFDKSDADVTVATPTAVVWGNNVQIPTAIGGGTGAITYAVKTDADSIGATVGGSGLVSGAAEAGSVVITVSRAADDNYEASSVDVIVTFNKSDADVTVGTPGTVAWGNSVQISDVIGGGTGAITYAVKDDFDSIGATVDNTGLVSGATKSGAIVVTVSRAGDDDFEASSVDVIVAFDKSDEDVTVATPTAVSWGTDVQISDVIGGGTGTITYVVKTDADSIGATVDGSTGLVSGATKAGSVVITVSRAADANYEASSADVIVTFDKSDIGFIVAQPGSVSWGTDVQISGVIGGGTGAITYVVKTDADSIGATVDGSGLVSGATKAGSVVITVSRAADANYEASSADVIVTFDKSDIGFIVAQPGSVSWGTDVQISGVIGGGTGAITYVVKTDADSIGATVDGSGLVSGATEAGSVVITVSRAADANYNASSADVIVTFDKSDADVTVATPTAAAWDTNIQISGVAGGGTGAITYTVTDADSIGAMVDGSGLVSGATKAGSVVITVNRAADANYNASSADVTVVFDKSDADVTVATPTAAAWDTNIQISGVAGGGTGAITYTVTDSDSIGAMVDGSGLVSGATKAGSVVITVNRAADANYNASSADVTVVFDKSEADVTVATPTAAAWDTNIQISGISGGGTGAITYTVKTDSDSIGATVDGSGLVSGATKAGSVIITVSRAADVNYEASSVDVTVVFDKSDADVTVATPAAVVWGNNVQIPTAIGGGTGAITYAVKDDSDSIGATVDNAGLVSGATKAGAIVVTVSRAGDDNFEASSVDVIVVFDKSDEDVTVATPTAVAWGNDIQISGVIGGGTGAITYVVKTDADSIGATVDGSTGLVSGATKVGSIVITVSRAADANYNASSADVIVTFDKSDADVTVATPTAAAWDTNIQISGVAGGGTGAITYTVTDADSIGAMVDGSGLVSGATEAGSVVITVSRAADDNYEASSVDVIVTFNKSDADVTVGTPTAVAWGNNVQISDVIGGGTGAITYAVKDDFDSIGATVDNTGLVSGATKAGAIVVTVSRAGDDDFEASSVDVIVAFDKSDEDVTVGTPAAIIWGNDIQIPLATGGGTGAITYTVKTDSDSIGATVDNAGLVSGATKAGAIVVTVSRAADANYTASSADVIVTFDKSDADVTVVTPASVAWDTNVQISGVSGGGTGAITYTVTDADSVGATVDGSGLVSGATKAGSVVITVSRTGDANFEASSVDVTVVFGKSDADVTVVTPASVAWDTNAQISGVSGGGTGTITYTVKTDSDSIGATVDSSGLVSGATKAGSVIITVSRAADVNYEASSVDVTVVFDKSDADVTVATPTAVVWGNNVQIPTAIGGGTGAITYAVKTDADSIGATVDGSGLVSGATEAGSVVITVSRVADDNYEASSVDVIVTFNKSDADVTVATPTAVAWGTDVQISGVIGGGTGAITYAVKDDSDSIGATVDNAGLVSGATKAGAIVVTVSRAGDDNFEASSVDVIVVFDKSDEDVTVATPTAVAWGNDIQISGVIGGGTGAITYAVKTDSDSIGATVNGAGLVSDATKAGSVTITVSRAGDANYNASSVDVIVAFDKSDIGFIVAQPGSVSWGTDVQISDVIGGGTGIITYVVKTDADSIGATVDGSTGLVSGATKAGSVVITVSRAADANYEASSADVIVTFDKSDIGFIVAQPGSVSWGTDVQISGVIGGGTGAITYVVKTDADSIGATVDGSGLVSGATEAGSVVITVSRAADANYNASSADVIVTFDKSDIGFIVAQPGSVSWGTDVQISGVIGGGTGAITYVVKTDADSIGATVDGSTGLVSGATKVGSIVITVSRAADANYNASSADVIVTFDKSDADVTVATPTAAAWDTNIQISGVAGGGTGAITYTVTDADSIGAMVDGSGLVSGATKAGSVVITVNRAADANYNASSADVTVVFDKSEADVTVATPTVAAWDTNIQISGISGGGTGAITYTVTDSDSIGAMVDGSGLVSGATKAGSVVITVNRAADANYNASSADVTVVFDKSEADVTVATPTAAAWDTNIQISGISGGGTGAITYTVKTDSDSIGATVDGSGLVSGATKAGSVIITVSRVADDNYEASSVDVIVTFNKSDADVTVATPTAVAWGTDVQISGVIGGGTGAITYAVKDDSDSIGATVDNAGLVSGATKAGAIVVTVSRAGDDNFEASSVDVIVVFDKSDEDVTVATPTAVAWGNDIQISGVIGGGTGAITYAVKTDSDSIGATVNGAGLVSDATKAGSVTITVSRAGDANYNASSVDVIVAFDKSDIGFIVAQPGSVSWGTDVQISDVIGGGTGIITYVVKTDADSIGATVDGSTGLVSGATKAGSVVITVSRAADANYEASSADVIVTFDKSDIGFIVAQPGSVSWGTDVQISGVIGGGTGAITYVVKTDADSIGATVDGSGLVSGATEAGSVVITVSRAADANYNASSADVIVTFDKSDADVTVATPTAAAWDTNIQISGVAGGGTGAITYTVTDADSVGAMVDGSGLVSGATKAGSVIITVSRAADANYNASSADVTVVFDKSDADVTVATPTAAAWDTNIQISGVAGGGTGAITYTVTDSDSIGAMVDGSGLVSGATKAGSVVITVNRAADANYNASSADVTVVFDKSEADVTVATPTAAAWDTNIQISGISGGGTGAITYTVKTDSDSIGATVDGSGLVSGATKAGSVIITVSRAADVNYEASSVDVTVVFDKSDADVTVATPAAVVWGNNVQIPTAIGGGTGAITYIVKTDADSIGAMVDGSGLVSGATEAGSVVITVSRAADDNYEASSVDVIVTFNKSDADVTVATPTAVAWGNDIQISGVIGGGTGAITYAVKDDFDSIGATVDNTGLVSGATKAGAIVVTVSRAGDDNFEASSVDVIVVFDKSDADVTVATPTAVVWGNNVQISDVIGGGTGAITYVVKTDADSIGATVDGSTGLVSGATKAGSVVITVSRAGDANYNASSADVIVTFDKSDIGFIVAQPGSVSWGTDVQISGVIGGGTGAITYTVTDADSIGATVDGSTGFVSGATKVGSVVITVSRAADANYNASSADVIVTFDKSDADVTVATPAAVIWGNDIQISGVAGGGTGAITYILTDADSVGATVDGAGLVSGAIKSGSVTVTVNRATDANYEASSVDVTVVFDRKVGTLAVATPEIDTWSTPSNKTEFSNAIALSGNLSGLGNGTVTYAVDPTGTTAINGRVGLNDGIVLANSSGDVVVTVTRAADDYYTEAEASVTVSLTKAILSQTTWSIEYDLNSGVYQENGETGETYIKGTGRKSTYAEFNLDTDKTTATGNIVVDLRTGVISGVTGPGDVYLNVTAEENPLYELNPSPIEVKRIFNASPPDPDGANAGFNEVIAATPTAVSWGTDVQISGVIGGGTGAITYSVKDDSDSIGATVDNAGLVSGATKAGAIVVTVSRAADDNYEASSVDVIVAFDKSDIGFIVAQPGSVSWGTDVQISGVIGGGTGAITYVVKTDADSIGATVDGSGLVSGTTEAGSVVITVSRAGDANYNASSADVIVTFDKSDIGFIVAQPGSVSWGTDVQISGVIGGGTGVITYVVKTDADSIGATVDGSNGVVSGATKVGSVVITVSRAADANYNASSADVIVTFDKSDADVTVATPTSVVWGTDVQISGVTGGGTGTISYAITTDTDSIGATVDGSTGLVSDVIKGGAVVVTVSRAGDDNFEASSIDVVVTFDKKASIGTLGADSMSIFSLSSFTLYKYAKISRNVGYNENGQTVTYSGPGIIANADGTVMSQSDGLVEVRAGKNCVIRLVSGLPHVYVLKDTVCNAQVTFEENDFYTEKVEFIEFIAAPDS